jgi:hypothetical protein
LTRPDTLDSEICRGGVAGPVQVCKGPMVVPRQHGCDVRAPGRGHRETAMHAALRHWETIFSYLRSRVNKNDV